MNSGIPLVSGLEARMCSCLCGLLGPQTRGVSHSAARSSDTSVGSCSSCLHEKMIRSQTVTKESEQILSIPEALFAQFDLDPRSRGWGGTLCLGESFVRREAKLRMEARS